MRPPNEKTTITTPLFIQQYKYIGQW
jgi:hypothetical protein